MNYSCNKVAGPDELTSGNVLFCMRLYKEAASRKTPCPRRRGAAAGSSLQPVAREINIRRGGQLQRHGKVAGCVHSRLVDAQKVILKFVVINLIAEMKFKIYGS